jgi:hypothetical protein
VRIAHSTITGNTSDVDDDGMGSGGGLTVGSYTFAPAGDVEINQTIIAGNIDRSETAADLQDLSVNRTDIGYSLIGGNSGSGLTEAPVGSPDAMGNIIGGPMHGQIDPMLGPLVYNGGTILPAGYGILTHDLLPGSPAINAGDPAAVGGMNGVPEFDQRGAPWSRVVGGRIDIGSVESQPNPLPGDYNFNEVVDAADYVIWRKLLTSTTDLRADGSGNGAVDGLDYELWQSRFGDTSQVAANDFAAGTNMASDPVSRTLSMVHWLQSENSPINESASEAFVTVPTVARESPLDHALLFALVERNRLGSQPADDDRLIRGEENAEPINMEDIFADAVDQAIALLAG